MKKYLLFLISLLCHTGFIYPQQSVEKLTIDYWLKNYNQVSHGTEIEFAQSVFNRVVTVADKPVGVLPTLYIFSNLKPYQLFATKDGGIVLPIQIIQFCKKNKIDGQAQLAFLLSHEIKHIVRGDYELREMLMKFIEDLDSQEDHNYTKQATLSPELNRLKAMEIQADQYGLLYSALAGFDIESIISPQNNFILKFYEFVGFDPYGSLSNPSVIERDGAIRQKTNKIIEHIDLFDYGIKLYAIGEYDAAIDVFTKFLSQFPSREVFTNRGLCYYQKAYLLYSKWKPNAINENPNFIFKLSPQIESTSRAEFATRSINQDFEELILHNLNKAITDFKEAERLDDQYPTIYNNLGCAYLLKGDLGFAKDYFKTSIKINKKYKEAHNNLAICYIAEGNGKTAESTLLDVYRLYPTYLDPIFNLGQLYAIASKEQDAKKYFNQYLQLANSNSFAEKAINYLHKQLPKESTPKFIENISGLKPNNLKIESDKWTSFQTPNSRIFTNSDLMKNIKYLYYEENKNNKRITIIGTDKRYKGKTFKAVKPGESEELVSQKYPFQKREISTSNGSFWVYEDLNLVFEIRQRKVCEWFLYDIR